MKPITLSYDEWSAANPIADDEDECTVCHGDGECSHCGAECVSCEGSGKIDIEYRRKKQYSKAIESDVERLTKWNEAARNA